MEATKITENWTENQIKYMEFLGRGKKDKRGERYTNEEFAGFIGVDPWTLYRWKRLPGFREAVFEYILAENLDDLPDLIKAQMEAGKRKGKGGDTQAFMALMRQFELLKSDKTDITSGGQPINQVLGVQKTDLEV